MKGQAIAELLANHSGLPSEKKEETHFNMDGELIKWTLYFDGAAVGMRGGAGPTGGAGVFLVEPSRKMHLHAYNLAYFCTNNSAKYEAMLLGLILAKELKVECLLVRGDSLLDPYPEDGLPGCRSCSSSHPDLVHAELKTFSLLSLNVY